jgi:hypothetical protein
MRRSPRRRPHQPEFEWAAGQAPSSGLVVHRTKEQERVALLAKEQERLLRHVARVKAALEEAEGLARDMDQALFARLQPLQELIQGIVRDLHGLFGTLLGPGTRLGKRHRGAVREVYEEVLTGIPGWMLETPGADPEGEPGAAPPRSREPPARPALKDMEAGPSAARPDAAPGSTLRGVFLRLTVALHPDKVQAAEEKDRRTRIMQDVTRAYEAGDVARLVELERSLLAPLPSTEVGGAEGEALTRQAEALLRSNAELRRQLRLLTARRKLLARSVPFRIDRGAPGGARAAAERDLDEAMAEAERGVRELEKVRDFVRRFAEGKIGVTEFLAGPPLDAGDPLAGPFEGEEETDALLQVLELLAREGLAQEASARRPRATRNRKRKR